MNAKTTNVNYLLPTPIVRDPKISSAMVVFGD
jgi:hypothetical protein